MSLRPDRCAIARLEWWHAQWERSNSRYVQYPTFLLSPGNADLLEIMERNPVVEDMLVLLEMIGFCSHFCKQIKRLVESDEGSNRLYGVRRFIGKKKFFLPMYAATTFWRRDEDAVSEFEYGLRDTIELVFDDWTSSVKVAAAVVEGSGSRELSLRNRRSLDMWSPYEYRQNVTWRGKNCACKIKLKELREAVK